MARLRCEAGTGGRVGCSPYYMRILSDPSAEGKATRRLPFGKAAFDLVAIAQPAAREDRPPATVFAPVAAERDCEQSRDRGAGE